MNEVEGPCKENGNVDALWFDFMQNFSPPHIPVQDLFCFRQLWVFVFWIHELYTNKGRIYHFGLPGPLKNAAPSYQ